MNSVERASCDPVSTSQIKVLRPECLTLSVRAFVTEKMGSKYLEGGQVSLREVYHHCTANTPIVFILSPGE